jgi:hypothetical protein
MALLFTLPRSVQFDAVGQLMPGWVVEFYATGTSDPKAVYSDPAYANSLGSEVQAGDDGSLRPIYLDDSGVAYKILIKDANGVIVPNGTFDPYFVGPSQSQIGRALYPRTTAEQSASVTPASYSGEPGDLRRYGGVGDGTTISTTALTQAALQAAQSGGASIKIAGGTYRIDQNTTIPAGVTLDMSEGGLLTIDNGVTLTINGPLIAPRKRVFSGTGVVRLGFGGGAAVVAYPEWWGAVPDGTTDCSAAINAAIAAAGQVILSFAAGVYSADHIALTTSSSLYGVSKDETIIRSRTATWLVRLINADSVAPCQLTIKDITFDGQTLGTVGFQTNNCAYFSIRDCKFVGFVTQGIYSIGSILYQVVRCIILNCPIGYDAETSPNSPTNAVTLQHTSISGSTSFAIRVRGGSMFVVDTCDIEFNGTAGNAATRAIDIADMDPSGLGVACIIKNTWFEGNNGLSAINIGPPDTSYSVHVIENCQIFGGTRTYGVAIGDSSPIKTVHLRNVVAQSAGTADFFIGTHTTGQIISCRGSTKSFSTDASVDLVIMSDPVNGAYKFGNNLQLSPAGVLSLTALPSMSTYANDAAAAAGGVAVGQVYRNGSVMQVRVS